MDTLSKEGDCYEEEKFNFESFVENERGIYQFMDEETMLCNVVDNGKYFYRVLHRQVLVEV